jgi:hypothetical protein
LVFFQWRSDLGLSKISNERLDELKECLYHIANENETNDEYYTIIGEIFKEISTYNKNPNIKTRLSHYMGNIGDFFSQAIKIQLFKGILEYEGKLSGGIFLLFIIGILICIIMILSDQLSIYNLLNL